LLARRSVISRHAGRPRARDQAERSAEVGYMHATIQKSLEEILGFLEEGEKVMVVGCGNCAAKAKSGGETETKAMAERLRARGITVTGWAVPPDGGSLCKLSATEKLLRKTGCARARREASTWKANAQSSPSRTKPCPPGPVRKSRPRARRKETTHETLNTPCQRGLRGDWRGRPCKRC